MTTQAPFSIPVGEAQKGESPVYRSVISPDKIVETPDERMKTLYDILHVSAERFGDKPLFGTRPVLGSVEEETQVTRNGEVQTKTWTFPTLGDYTWKSYNEVVKDCGLISSGLLKIGMQPQDRLIIFAATSADWMIMAQSCFQQSITIATAYDTLGEEGLLHALNQTKASVLFTNPDLLKVAIKVIGKAPHLKHIVHNGSAQDSTKAQEDTASSEGDSHPSYHTLDEIRALGKDNLIPAFPPQARGPCMHHGVLLTHANLVGTIGGVQAILGFHVGEKDTLLAYLPLAHVLEFAVETVCIFWGVSLGYGSPRTLSDISVRKCKGDIRALRPTLMAGVPAVWDKIRKGVMDKVSNSNPIVRAIFNAACKAKWACTQAGIPSGWANPIFRSVKDQTGGRLRYVLSGGAPISRESQKLLSTIMCTVLQGYGLTETCGMCTILPPEAFELSRTGAPVPCVEVKLVDCPDAGYTSSDKPHPRGEVWIRGTSVTKGYYQMEKETEEAFTEDGWFKTGDIGSFDDNGLLSIIDRKKNLVKLANGEYIALEKLESVYKSCQAVGNICVCANSYHHSAVALIHPIAKEVLRVAKSQGKGNLQFHEACEDPKVRQQLLKEIVAEAKAGGLKGTELIADCYLCEEEWTAENNLLTAAQKMKRKEVQETFQDQLDEMYKRID
ncbi:hypothetical protein BJ684DRAFT_18411 [Piptocephalis cylindrospora]|uniref:AMP-dependent synthetase/ligase domain-containing protein n=1 Tax=Piptocephalis cylindrospora TaxID=1907219 RepID=A0A4P9Y847_9FUNG|nr:hypothetical protein BJ684DRAFT_18411 [Piptocephalis cylindrospora]|eukprot:RKP15243.1 hypothetical protein BJ684DRAFT_18411 [Piptocephalis cylindrospora]